MSLVLQLRSERAKLNDELQALAKKEAGGEALAAADLERFAQLETQIADLSAKIARAESAERSAAAAAVPVNESAQGNNSPPGAAPHITVQSNAPRGAGVAQMARLLAATQGNQMQAADLARAGGYPEQVVMALSTTTPGAGGVLVPVNMATEVIESLRPTSVLRGFGARPLPLLNGNMALPRIKGNTTVSYIGVDDDIPATTMVFEDLKLQAKKMSALVPIANDLLRFQGTNPQVDQLVASDLLVSVGLYEDITFIRSAGSATMPKGLRYWAPAANVVVAPAGATMADIDAFCGGLMLRVEMANANMAGCGWIMNPRTIRYLQTVRDGNGNLAYPEINDGKFKGYPYKLSTQIPVNLGAGADESEIYFGDYSDCYIGETGEMYLSYSAEATYKNANGDLVSAFSKDQTLVRLIQHNDFGPRHVESIAVGTGVKWGKAMLA